MLLPLLLLDVREGGSVFAEGGLFFLWRLQCTTWGLCDGGGGGVQLQCTTPAAQRTQLLANEANSGVHEPAAVFCLLRGKGGHRDGIFGQDSPRASVCDSHGSSSWPVGRPRPRRAAAHSTGRPTPPPQGPPPPPHLCMWLPRVHFAQIISDCRCRGNRAAQNPVLSPVDGLHAPTAQHQQGRDGRQAQSGRVLRRRCKCAVAASSTGVQPPPALHGRPRPSSIIGAGVVGQQPAGLLAQRLDGCGG